LYFFGDDQKKEKEKKMKMKLWNTLAITGAAALLLSGCGEESSTAATSKVEMQKPVESRSAESTERTTGETQKPAESAQGRSGMDQRSGTTESTASDSSGKKGVGQVQTSEKMKAQKSSRDTKSDVNSETTQPKNASTRESQRATGETTTEDTATADHGQEAEHEQCEVYNPITGACED
jgi:hypothetical protein